VKLLALDLDGTLLEPGERILPETIEALEEAVEKGVIVGTASGRSLADQLRILSANRLGPAAGYPHFLIADECRIFLLRGGRYEGLNEHNERLAALWRSAYERAKELLASEVSRLVATGARIVRVVGEEEALERCLFAVIFEDVASAEAEEKAMEELLAGLPLHSIRNGRVVAVLAEGCDKGSALLKVCKVFGVEPGEAVAVGDSGNDIPMLDGRYGFKPATVQNAEETVKRLVESLGGYVASKPRSAGVAEIVQKLLPT
jgi:HAD superfamily hydrolase (TIGR01484 family)